MNVGTGDDITIKELAETVKSVTGFNGDIAWDTSKPDGTMLKRMDVSRINELGWKATTPFPVGLEKAYHWYLENPIRT